MKNYVEKLNEDMKITAIEFMRAMMICAGIGAFLSILTTIGGILISIAGGFLLFATIYNHLQRHNKER